VCRRKGYEGGAVIPRRESRSLALGCKTPRKGPQLGTAHGDVLLSRSKQNELLQEDVVDSKFFEGVKTAQTLMFEGTRLFGKGGKVALIQACRECDWRRAARKTRREVLPRQAPFRASWPNIHLLTLEHGRSFPQAPSFSNFNPVSDFQQLRMLTISLTLVIPNPTS
jgi:hypothetical protein